VEIISATMIPKIATASQKMTLTKFLERILGAFTEAPIRDDPMRENPQPAPTPDSPMANPQPSVAHTTGDIVVKKKVP